MSDYFLNKNVENIDQFMTIEEVSKRLNVSKETIRTMIGCGVLEGGMRFKKKYAKRYTYKVNRKQFDSVYGVSK